MRAGLPRLLLQLLLAAVAVAQAILLVRFEVNWDEFLNLSMIYDHQRGELRSCCRRHSFTLSLGFVRLAE